MDRKQLLKECSDSFVLSGPLWSNKIMSSSDEINLPWGWNADVFPVRNTTKKIRDAKNVPNPDIFDNCDFAVNFLGWEIFRGLGYFYSDLNFRVTVLFLVQFYSSFPTINLHFLPYKVRRKTTVTPHFWNVFLPWRNFKLFKLNFDPLWWKWAKQNHLSRHVHTREASASKYSFGFLEYLQQAQSFLFCNV